MNDVFRLAFLFCLLTVNLKAQQPDRMAEIGNKPAAVRLHLLETPQPPQLPQIVLPAQHNKRSAFKPMQRLDTEQELQTALSSLREKYKPFLQNLAPELNELKTIVNLEKFQWRKETAEDQQSFQAVVKGEGKWETVTLPHYGPPLGKAVTYYRTPFTVTAAMLQAGAVFIKFKGVDYKAHVFVNGYYLGSHEGIFAPFEFEISRYIGTGENTLLIQVENDYPMQGHVGDDGVKRNGDKIYASTGPGYNDPILGWHHSPPAMGIYQAITLESRSSLHIHDIFVRPLADTDSAEVWLEINNTQLEPKAVKIRHSLYGQNFKGLVYENQVYEPLTIHIPGVGDLAKPTDNKLTALKMEGGVNFLKFKIAIPGAKRWNPETPWLYQLQVQLVDENNRVTDHKKQHFGMRSFRMDTVTVPKGMMYLNGKPIRLRGANTMGAFQQSVMKKDWAQLIDDILLAKLTNMNFIRMTQLPVQSEVYDYCDRLGLMTQTDLPLFGVLRRNKWMEAVRQAEEMERLVRNHPSNIVVTYINERFPNAEGAPHRHLDSYNDFARFFKAADQAILMSNPDRVIKAGDGDYDPPSPGLPDNHVYNGWYNGHGLGLGEMHQGYWVPVKPDWYFACGEFGSEGLDNYSTMLKHYPKEWLPKEVKEPWTPEQIAMNQSFRFHRMWYATPKDVMGWIGASQKHQADMTRLTTEAFRRENRMVSFAIHLFIDAWPAGWMKTIMDVERKPKQAWYAYQHALAPVAVQLRTDRYDFYSNESLSIEAWIANDKLEVEEGQQINYQLEKGGKVLWSNEAEAKLKANQSVFQGFLKFQVPEVNVRTDMVLRLALFSKDKKAVHETDLVITVHPKPAASQKTVWAVGHKAKNIARDMQWKLSDTMEAADAFLMDSLGYYHKNKEAIDQQVSQGKKLVLLELPVGSHQIGADSIKISSTIMGSYYFVSITGHPMLSSFKQNDFKFWYDQRPGAIRPFLSSMINQSGWEEILRTGTTSWTPNSSWSSAACEKKQGSGAIRICQLQMEGKLNHNPTAFTFMQRLLE